MKQEDAIRYAEAMQEHMGNRWTTYSAIQSHIHQTWVVRLYYSTGLYHHETLFKKESDLIHYLIGYAGEAMKETRR